MYKMTWCMLLSGNIYLPRNVQERIKVGRFVKSFLFNQSTEIVNSLETEDSDTEGSEHFMTRHLANNWQTCLATSANLESEKK